MMSYDAHSDAISTCDFNSTGTEFITGSHDGLVRVWDGSHIGICKNTFYCDSCPPM
jgi:WD40 repeat protein